MAIKAELTDHQVIELETTRAHMMVYVCTLWDDGHSTQEVMELHSALQHQLLYVGMSKAITIWRCS